MIIHLLIMILALQGNPLMLPPMPIHQGNPNGHITSGMGGRSRGHGGGRGRGGGSQRRNNYHTPRHMQQQLQPQQQQMPPESASPAPNAMQLQQDQMGQQLAPPPPPEVQLQPMSYYAPSPYAPYSGYQTAYFASHHGPIQASPNAAAAAAAQGAPVYISHMPLYNYMGGYIYPMMPPSEYQYITEDGGQGPGGVVDDRQAQEMPQLWHPAPMYAEEYQEVAHVNGDELNHNSSSLASSETSSMLSPNYPIYDAQQMHEMQQQMGVMQIYDDGQLAPLQAMHPVAGPVPQVSRNLLFPFVGQLFIFLFSFFMRSMRMNYRTAVLHLWVPYPSLGHCLQMFRNHLYLFRHHLHHIISFRRSLSPHSKLFALNSRHQHSSS